nr:uncharacterized protein LOC123770019 isoform X3 [Procambarus clarkii]XP_045617538.1 uncharacterized protein LOC123770019 isoform X3 [Procambarus clarkii]
MRMVGVTLMLTGLAATTQVWSQSSQLPTPGSLICYSCKLDFRKREYQWDHPCLGHHNNHTVSDDYLVHCGRTDTLCRVERTEVNGILTMLKRECTNICYESCRPKGFGINYELCVQCCDKNGCNSMYPQSGVPPHIPSSSWIPIVIGCWVVTPTLFM